MEKTRTQILKDYRKARNFKDNHTLNDDEKYLIDKIVEAEIKLKNHSDLSNVSERVQRIAVYFAKKNPTPTKWANDILKYILEGSKHDR
jgi:hypothetical protein